MVTEAGRSVKEKRRILERREPPRESWDAKPSSEVWIARGNVKFCRLK